MRLGRYVFVYLPTYRAFFSTRRSGYRLKERNTEAKTLCVALLDKSRKVYLVRSISEFQERRAELNILHEVSNCKNGYNAFLEENS